MPHKKLLIGSACALLMLVASASYVFTKETGTPIDNEVGYTGGIREQGRTCGTTQCHFVNGGGNIFQRDSLITSNVPPEGYSSGVSYQMSVSLSEPSRVKYGFMASPQANNVAGDARGKLSVIDDSSQLRSGTNYIAVTHTLAGTAAPNESKTWHFKWTAPMQTGLGEVLFFVACNASNDDDTSTGDRIYLDTLFIPERIGNGNHDLLLSKGISAQLVSNPVRDVAIISLNAQTATVIEHALYDLRGHLLVPFEEFRLEGQFRLTIDLTKRPRGPYLVVLRSGDKTSCLRVLRI
jgi:hypothetical protein